MSSTPNKSQTSQSPKPNKAVAKPSVWRVIRNRIIAGLFVALPLFITYAIIKWLYETLYTVAIGPISRFLLDIWYPDQDAHPFAIEYLLAPATAFGLGLGLLFIAGMFFRSRLYYTVDWILNNVPGVNMVYSVVSNVFNALQRSQSGTENFKRVVLVQFPHPGMKVPAFVTSECREETTGETILCVYVPTTPVPTSGYMLMVPDSEVVSVDWDLQDTLQAIVSGGITVPEVVRYHPKKIA